MIRSPFAVALAWALALATSFARRAVEFFHACPHEEYRPIADRAGWYACADCGHMLHESDVDPRRMNDPDWSVWEGETECSLCGFGKDGRVRSVVPIPRGDNEPIIPLECARCRNMTLHPR